MPMLRKDPISGRWVIIATERAKRPRDYRRDERELDSEFCPFCAGNEHSTPKAVATYPSDTDEWDVRVVPNKFPALQTEGNPEPKQLGPYEVLNGVGAHEVIIESASHVTDFAELPSEQIATVLRSWKERIETLRDDDRLECAVVFKNHGAPAGASLEHAHSQLIALPVVPKRLSEELKGVTDYREEHESCVFCDLIDHEVSARDRIVCENDDFIAFAPFASRFPFELCMLPRDHRAWYEEESYERLNGLAALLKSVIKKLNRALDHPPFNLMLHSAPFPGGKDWSDFHWHFELIPKLTKVAGFEWGTGFYINPTPPEVAARHLRDIQLD